MKQILAHSVMVLIIISSVQGRISLDRLTQFPYNGFIDKASFGDEYQVDFSDVPQGNDIQIKFEVKTSNVLTSTFLAVSSNQTKFKSKSIQPNSFYGVNFTYLEGTIDVVGLQLGTTQYINRKKIDNSDNILYFTVYNLDPVYRCPDVNFTITINIDSNPGISLDCYPCLNHGRRKQPSQSCLCDRCDAGYYGPDCSINMRTLTKGQATPVIIDGPGMAFFLIDEANQVNVLVKQSVGFGEVYVQFIFFDGEFASYTNVARGKTIDGKFNVTAGTGGTSFPVPSIGTKISVTVAAYTNETVTVEASYQVNQKSSVLLIVLAVVGSVLFVGLVISAIYIIRNSSWFQNGRSSRQIRPVIQNLKDYEIQRFFPTVLFKNISPSFQSETSNMELKENSSTKIKVDAQDCAICICPIEAQQSIKITYCKHIFHAQCLMEWFRKNQNCPYCRQEFTKVNTVNLYKKIKQGYNGNVLKGEELVNAILSQQKSIVIASKNSIDELNEKQTHKLKRQSRTNLQIQNLS